MYRPGATPGLHPMESQLWRRRRQLRAPGWVGVLVGAEINVSKLCDEINVSKLCDLE